MAGEFPVGTQIPTEVVLVEDYGVSRITVRQALRAIEDEGLIRREAGRGTFVIGMFARVRSRNNMKRCDVVILNGQVVLPGIGPVRMDLGIREGKIAAMSDKLDSQEIGRASCRERVYVLV